MTPIGFLQHRLRPLLGRVLARAIRRRVERRVRRSKGVPPATTGPIAIVGFFARENGIAEGARLQQQALDTLGHATARIDASAGIYNPFATAAAPAGSRAIICHADGMQLSIGLNVADRSRGAALRIGYCAWELAEPPRHWGRFDRAFHEIWTPSRFSADALERMCRRPVRVVRHVVIPPLRRDGAAMRAALGIGPEEVVALAMGDVRSSFARKNPLGAIRAVAAANRAHGPITLVMKITAAAKRPDLVDRLRQAAGDMRMILVDRHLDDDARWALLDAADLFVSLHRAEGFGLPMLEAMTLGKPVVATGWSGNMDVMDAGNARIVAHRLVPVDDPQGMFAGGHWAEPDEDHAATLIAQLVSDEDLRARLGAAARAASAPDRQLAAFAAQLGATALRRPVHRPTARTSV